MNKTNLNLFLLLILCSQNLFASPTKVIIIGAGASGIAAAKTLNENNIETIILEGRDRIGGRISTDTTTFGYPIELGAILITQQKENPLLKLADENKIRQVPVRFDNIIYFTENGKVLKKPWDRLAKQMRNYIQFMKQNPQIYDKTVGETLNIYLQAVKMSRLEIIIMKHCASSFNLSLKRNFDDVKDFILNFRGAFNGNIKMTPDGYINILKPVADKINIQLNTTVTEIVQDVNKIVVKDNKGVEHVGDYVVITVPLGYLKQNLIKFTPALNKDKQEAIDKLAFFKMNKLFVEFESKFWGDEDYITFLTPPLVFEYTFNFHNINGKNILIFFIYEDRFPFVKNKSNEELEIMIKDVMTPVYGEDKIKINKIYLTNWNDDKFTYGSFSEVSGHEYLRKRFTEPEGRLLFAGEHTSLKHNAFVYGAYMTGIRAAKQILKFISNKKKNAFLK